MIGSLLSAAVFITTLRLYSFKFQNPEHVEVASGSHTCTTVTKQKDRKKRHLAYSGHQIHEKWCATLSLSHFK